MMTALGSGVSPQACRQAWIKRLSRRRHSQPGPAGEQRVQRAERNVAQLANRAPLHAAERRHGVIAQTLPASSRMQKDKLKTAAAVR